MLTHVLLAEEQLAARADVVHPLLTLVLGADAHAVEFVDPAFPRKVFLDVAQLRLAASPVADIGEIRALLTVLLTKGLAAVHALGHGGAPA